MVRRVKDIVKYINGELTGDGEVEISGVASIEDAKTGDIAFVMDNLIKNQTASVNASCVIAPKNISISWPIPVIKVDEPSIAFSKAIGFIFPDGMSHPKGVHPSATISKKAKLGNNVSIGACVVIEDGVSVGDDTILYPLTYIGKNTRIGASCLIYANVTIREEVIIGDRVSIFSGSVIGSDGFGYDTRRDGTHVKIPQLGTVVIEDDVEIGACVCIDRARFNKTVIGKGTKIDNLVQIAHNVAIGPCCLIAAQSGIAGSTSLGRNVVMGGQSGIIDHARIGNFVQLAARSGISKTIVRDHAVLFGYPAKPIDKARVTQALIGLLPKLFEKIKALEARIEKLEK